MGHKGGIARSLGRLGGVAASQGEYATAAALYQECLALRRELGDQRSIANCLERLAGLAARCGEMEQRAGSGSEGGGAAFDGNDPRPYYERAARLLGAAAVLRERLGTPLAPSERDEHERWVRIARAELEAITFETVWAEGLAMPLEQAMNYAMRPAQEG